MFLVEIVIDEGATADFVVCVDVDFGVNPVNPAKTPAPPSETGRGGAFFSSSSNFANPGNRFGILFSGTFVVVVVSLFVITENVVILCSLVPRCYGA